jgi:hypothetical protein
LDASSREALQDSGIGLIVTENALFEILIYCNYLHRHTQTGDLSKRNAKFMQKQHMRQKNKIIQNLHIVT